MRIPVIQARLAEIALLLNGLADEIQDLTAELNRRSSVTRAKRTSTPVTPAIKKQVRNMVKNNPGMPYNQIAAVLNINPGRVSEIINGHRE